MSFWDKIQDDLKKNLQEGLEISRKAALLSPTHSKNLPKEARKNTSHST